MRYPLLTLLLPLLLCTCGPAQETEVTTPPDATQQAIERNSNIALADDPNPAAPGFNAAGSDRRAIAVADSIVKYHGGRAAWDATRYLRWNFFGTRDLHWDRQAQRVRIDVPSENTVYLLDYSERSLTGRVRIKGNEVTDPEQLSELLQKAYSIFINDSFWLVQQFKLKDDGVTLKLLEDVNIDPLVGRPSYVLEQTFDGVGDTPQNRYLLYVDKRTYKINTWQFFRDAADTEPAMETPWDGLVPYRGILLSSDRGGKYQLSDIGAPRTMRESLFTEF